MKASDIQKNKNRNRRKRNKALMPYLIALYVLCFFAFFYSALNLRYVLIDNTLPLLLAAFCGLIAVFFTRDRNSYFFAIIGYGSLLIGVPLFINNMFADVKDVEMKLPIKNRQHARGKHGASVEVRYNDFDKEILIDDDADLDNCFYIVLNMNKGLLGYYIIRETRLVKE
ncbi:hypothetical protein [Mucilaginibacter celer]|uniref:Uncharacterized protein n=1 Tax=Mucilaginibacter celer TaxID=2305508 RepID=A0A494VPV3_9SPHI|nr:hypothetical protein [Mucilaginibacter celer]AYL96329.1 hypothetical protein HYN43_013950 [Mucilaginibacter celer]